ncbi:hypothetical protein C9374_004188 [Naegleria lovaniensis]|uniref:Uncharacterized protein n=1 Tax=Naegleria lovaniensis TaxID=51637 RepID=A0AA88GS12_NAELO|nr:uncharacterized protein C9374_004188 [Naegleria lovaniensis]KAG2383517.1 hypothetical protein C9374_004188 [Naegleria lovaniensis]
MILLGRFHKIINFQSRPHRWSCVSSEITFFSSQIYLTNQCKHFHQSFISNAKSNLSSNSNHSQNTKRLAIIGGGAAGLMSAIFAQTQALQTLQRSKNNLKTIPQEIEIYVLERKPQCGRKILMSGGTRCNLLPHESKWPKILKNNLNHANSNFGNADLELKYFTTSPELLIEILKTWPIEKQKEFFEKNLKIALELEEETGKYFPESNDAKQVLTSLLQFIQDRNTEQVKVKIMTDCNVNGLEKDEFGNWKISFLNDQEINKSSQYPSQYLNCHSVILSSGGLSVINSDGYGIQLLEQLGHEIIPLYPALNPLIYNPEMKHILKELSGVTLPNVTVSVYLKKEHEQVLLYQSLEPKGFLFTHTGYSGPAILNASHATISGLLCQETLKSIPNPQSSVEDDIRSHSSYAKIEKSIIEKLIYKVHTQHDAVSLHVHWTPQISAQDWDKKFTLAKQQNSKLLLKNFIHKNSEPNFLPIRLVQLITDSVNLSDVPVSQLSLSQKRQIISQLTSFELPYQTNMSFKKAEVTGGGCDWIKFPRVP